MTMIDLIAQRFEDERMRAQQKKILQQQKERAQLLAQAARAKRENDNSILW